MLHFHENIAKNYLVALTSKNETESNKDILISDIRLGRPGQTIKREQQTGRCTNYFQDVAFNTINAKDEL